MRKKKETVEETLNEETTAKKKETTLASKKKTTTRKPRTTKKKAETTAVEVKAPVEEGSVPAKEETIPTEEGNAKMAVTEQNEVLGNVEAKNNPETGTTITEQKEVKPIVEPKVEETKAAEVKAVESNVAEVTEVTAVEVSAETSSVEAEPTDIQEAAKKEYVQEQKKEIRILPLPQHPCKNIIELSQAPQRAIILTDQQIQQLSLEEITHRHSFLEATLMNVLDYDVVISDTNIWLELLIGHTSSHSDPRFNARLQFERQLEFISKLTHYRGGRFIMMAETYEEIDRFACMQDPTNHREADWSDNIVCLNAAARLAKRLILAQQRENRLRIVGIGAESHHASFADPAIVRKVAELFAEGKKVLLLTNDASVAIRSMGICDDLQHYNHISDVDWDEHYAPLRPMVFTFDDLKLLDYYTRQYHYIQMAAGAQWMQDVPDFIQRNRFEPLMLCMDAFRPGDKHKGDNLFTEQEKQVQQQKLLNQNQQKQKQNNNQQQKQQQKQQTQQQKQQNQQVQQQKQQNQQAQQQKQQNQQAQQQKQKQQQQSETVNTQETAKESVAATQQAEMTAANKSANVPATASDNTDKKPAEQKKNTSRRKGHQ